MELDEQLKILIDDAAQYNVPPIVIERAIAPVLRLLAQNLKYPEYYILQNLASDWVLTTIVNSQTQQEKKVIYAYATVKDAATANQSASADILAAPILVTHLLFRLFSLSEVDSVIFLDNSANLNTGVEIQRPQLVTLIQQQIKQLSSPPPNIA